MSHIPFSKSLHAEVNGCRKFSRNRKRKEIKIVYVVRLLLDKHELPESQTYWLGNAKPCQHCQEVLFKSGVKKIKYTDIHYENGRPINVLCELRSN